MNKLYNDTAVQAIANAIRSKNGSSDTYNIAEMSTALNDFSYYAKPTISNISLATFEADGLPLNKLKVGINAVQDLHGYDKPWPASGGKNLIDMQGKYTTSIGIDTLLLPAGEYYVYIFTEGDIGTYNSFTYYSTDGDTFTEINTTDDGVAVCDAKLQYNRKKSHITLHENAYLRQSLQINTGVSGKQIYVMITKDGADYSSIANIPPYSEVDNIWEPYSNICPISGWDAANVVRCGKNFFNVPQTVTSGSVTFNCDADGYCTATPSDSDNRLWSKANAQYSLWLKSGSYKFIWDVKTASTSSASGWTLYDEAGDVVSYGNGFATSGSTTFTTQTGGTYYLQCKIHNSIVRFMVVLADETATSYEPYNGTTTTISLPQTVYGGELDVVNGILKITDGYISSYNGETLPSTWISSMDVYAEGTTPTTGAEVCYELAEPIIINLTPSLIKSLNGQNNLSVDCGEVIELEYIKEV